MLRALIIVLLFIAFLALLGSIIPFLVMMFWNYIIVKMVPVLPIIGFWTAIGFCMFITIIGKILRGWN